MSSGDRIERLERRLNGLKRNMTEIREENQELRKQLSMMHAYNAYMEDRLDDLNDKLEDYRENFQQIRVNESRLDDVDLRMRGKVGTADFSILNERVRQLRARIDFLTDYLDVEQWDIEKEEHERLKQQSPDA